MPRVIDPRSVWYLAELQALLRLPGSCLKREVRLGRLRVAKRSGRYLTTGEWVWNWIISGEIKTRNAAEQGA
jgi:hypothetical protein